ncbi:uncharacterized protein LOC106710827 [Papilio machaon]|uniref:uncharacterized protein LOC106710827 n=1 Tax=Papilio machaon TaxID=76193 RepID=UPI001E6630A2|nr:uncharacterized protein LOC106710827 [Papilio machaon]
MENTTSKHRTPSQCREWERLRRNRFNEAISKLGQIVKDILKDKPQFEASSNVQYPKIEIVQKAILCLTTCVQEKTQLKAEILALQVKLEAEKNVKPDKKDASIQVSAVMCKKNKNGKFVKLVMLQKSKKKNLKEKPSVTQNEAIKQNIEGKPLTENKIPNKNMQTLPKLLPLTSTNNKKGIENTIVMLPSTPYISFPQRPLLFPAVPPTIVFLDSNLQPINKPATIPIINRNNADMTKTTMVNVLPISAYSRPMSATRTKKNNVKPKQNVKRKHVKKGDKQTAEVSDESSVTKDTKTIPNENINSTKDENVTEKIMKISNTNDCNKEQNENKENNVCVKNSNDSTFNDKAQEKSENVMKSPENSEPNTTCSSTSNADLTISASIAQKPTEGLNNESREINLEGSSKPEKICPEKELLLVEKDKVNKLPNILDTALCDNVVDGGNARLELAEEFLAASPTAAFLMSFPLVSGNRADSPAEDHQNIQASLKENHQRRNEVPSQAPYFPKPHDVKGKMTKTDQNITQKQTEQQKFISNTNISKEIEPKVSTLITNSSNDNPFLHLSMPSLAPTSCPLTDSTFSLDFDCTVSKANHPVSVASSNNFFYKSDALSSTKTSIYSTSNISSGHEFNSLGLYPCAMEKFSTKNKSDFSNMEENLMKIGPSRLTYDIDLGWSHKGFDFVTCTTTSTTFNKDNILTSAPSQYSTAYNPFNPDFHVPLVTNSSKKDMPCKAISSFPEAITSFYSQPTNLWSEDMTFYTSNNFSKNFTPKPQNFVSMDHNPTNVALKTSAVKQYETKLTPDTAPNQLVKPLIEGPPIISDKYTKKSPSKMHINWMTSEIRPMQNNCNPSQANVKENHKPLYPQNIPQKKQDHNEGNYFPINMQNFPSQVTQEEFQVWPTARPVGTTEISIEPPPINLPTLVGDLALGPHDKKKNEAINRILPQTDLQNCNNFFSVTQLMNRSSDVMPPRYHGANMDTHKTNPSKQNVPNVSNDTHRKGSRLETHLAQPCHVFESKPVNYETMGHFTQNKQKNNKSDKSAKNTKTSYSAEALIRGGPCNQKAHDTISKFLLPPQKYNEFNVTQESGVAQVSHFPPLLEYPDNSYAGQQFSGTTLYNSTTNTISNSFYSNFMPGSSNLMTGNYTSGHFQSDFIDYNQPAECNYTNYKYDDLKMKANTTLQDKPLPTQYKGSRRESTTKHKLECSKKESSKKCNSKRAKLTNEVEEWNDSAHMLWQSKAPTRRHPNISEDYSFPNYVGNQISASSQYQPELFNTHLMPSNMQSVGHNIDRSLTTFPPTSRANFNLSTIFPEITMKVQ